MPDSRNYHLDYRPHAYWGAPAARFANVKGEQRRQAIERAIAEGRLEDMPSELRADVLSPELRDQVGSIDPSYMGGEYLPDYLPGEVEIARVALRSTTGDITSIRARKVGKRIRYRVVGGYEDAYRVSPQSSSLPLTLGQVIRLIDTTMNGGGFVGLAGTARDSLFDGSNHEELATFVHVSSPFYPELEVWYEEEAAEWLERKREEVAEARIYTDIKHGDKALRKFRRRLTGRWEFIAKGETSETPYNQWVCAYWLGKSADGSVYALRMDDFGDPDDLTKKGEPRAARCRVVAVFDKPDTADESEIVRRLLAVYRKHGGKWIELFHDSGRFDLTARLQHPRPFPT
jgi:hypothetical protein